MGNRIQFIKATWGMDGLPLSEAFARIAQAGYTGVESGLPEKAQESEFKELLAKHNLDFVAMVFTNGDHIASFEEQVSRAVEFKPLLINAHSSKDSAPYAEQIAFYEQAVKLEQQVGITVGHETHRGRAMFTPWATAQLLRDVPGLSLTADFSHWVCVCESLLHDQAEALELAISRTVHIHSRVGYAEGPQVPHPAAPEYQAELAAHEGWWKRIVEARSAQGLKTTITPEFGPPGYMHTLPFSNVPVADLWDVCLWMKKNLEEKLNA
ncbi:sugar phosphate isomerase/epimerase family protein [Paenibacillus gansuensis]|uniref:Sugar phosphate isomerase/epimerase family protein n=1 Tax=Paenibacillus gansuensis TaxID=306542 RepID=A0ABW5PFU7_9BACL